MKIKIGEYQFFVGDIMHVAKILPAARTADHNCRFTISFKDNRPLVTITDSMVGGLTSLEEIRAKLQKRFEEYYEEELILF